MRKLPYTPEGQEWAETEQCLRMCINQGVTYQDTILMVDKHLLLFQNHTSYTIKGRRHFLAIKLTNVLVSFGTKIISLVFMESEIELCSMLNYCFI